MFRRLGVFVSWFDLDAACTISPGEGAGAAADLVGRLADKSLLVSGHGSGSGQWRMLDTVRAYALERKTFGVPIAQHQAIQFMLADMATEIDAARLLARFPDQRAWTASLECAAGGPRGAGRPRPAGHPAPGRAAGAD